MQYRIPSVILGNNAKLIAAIAPLYLDGKTVIDVTYGKGNWWKKYREPDVAHDLITDGVDFRNLPYDDCSFDVRAYDPPYLVTGSYETSTNKDFHDRFGLKKSSNREGELYEFMVSGQHEACRVVKVGGFVLQKCQAATDGSRYINWPCLMTAAVPDSCVLWDEIVHFSGLGPQPLVRNGKPTEFHRTQRAASTLLIFKKVK